MQKSKECDNHSKIKIIDQLELEVTRFIDSISSGFPKFPPSLHISLIDKCFNRCITCNHWTRDNMFRYDIEDLLKLLEYGKQNGLNSVVYTGGDPFAYGSDINKLISFHLENEISIGFVTAGYIPSGVNFDLLKKCDFISISLDAVGEQKYSECRSVLPFAKVDKSIKELIKHDVKIRVAPTIHKMNYNHLPKILEYVINNKIGEVRISTAFNRPELLFDDWDTFINMLIKWKKILETYEIIENFNYYISPPVYSFNKCYAALFQCYVDAKGDVFPCCIMAGDTEGIENMSSIGNLRLFSPKKWLKVWNNCISFSRLNKNNRPIACNNCTWRFKTLNQLCQTSVHHQLVSSDSNTDFPI